MRAVFERAGLGKVSGVGAIHKNRSDDLVLLVGKYGTLDLATEFPAAIGGSISNSFSEAIGKPRNSHNEVFACSIGKLIEPDAKFSGAGYGYVDGWHQASDSER